MCIAAFSIVVRYNKDLEIEDAVHTAILTLKVCACTGVEQGIYLRMHGGGIVQPPAQ